MKDKIIYEWLEYVSSKKINEDKLKDFVSSSNLASLNAAGALDVEFTSGAGDAVSIDPNWVSQNIVSVTLVNGGHVQFNKRFSGQLKTAVEAACRATGWTPENMNVGYCPKPNGGFVARRSRAPSDSRKSVEQRGIGGHAWGTSIDLGTAQENPMGGGGKIRQFPDFINAMTKNGFIWGGNWTNKDDMHFEVNTTGLPQPEMGDASGSAGAMSPSEINPMSTLGRDLAASFGLEEQKEHKNIFKINDESKDKVYSDYGKYFNSLLEFLKKKIKLDTPVEINFIGDEKNSKKVLGKTGGYANKENKIYIFTDGRHIKDIMRSLSHEIIHHGQNIRGEFKDDKPRTKDYAQKDSHLRKMEKEAYLKGNILFRDWEDTYKRRGNK